MSTTRYHLAGAAAVIARRQIQPYEPTGPLLLRTCRPGGLSYGGFVWPLVPGAFVEAPDWDPTPGRCGGGLHGLLRGCGPSSRLDWLADAVWMVVEALGPLAETDEPGKVRCQRACVIVAGTREEVTGYLVARGCVAVHGAVVTSGYGGTSISGNRGTSTSGNRGTSTSGYRGTSASGDWGTSTSGYGGTSTSGYGGTSTSGNGGTSTSGNRGTSTSGNRGTSTSGYSGTSTSGNRGTLILRWNDGTRYRLTVAYVGEDGIEPGVPYRADEQGRPVRAGGGA